MVIAPQARTDLVIRPVNYADQLLENTVSDRVFRLFHGALSWQAKGKPVERNLLIDATFRLKSLLVAGFDEAADAFSRLQRERGWVERRPGSGAPPLAGVTDREIDRAFDNMEIQVQGPTHYGNLPEIVLGMSQEITERATPQLAKPGEMESLIEAVRSNAG
jgi:hypothetical protein